MKEVRVGRVWELTIHRGWGWRGVDGRDKGGAGVGVGDDTQDGVGSWDVVGVVC